MTAKTIMIQGTSSSVGKSLLVAGLCRIFNDAGFQVAPFKSQNMALNSAVTPDGYEISRSQTMQAEAARALPIVEMNPILLKPKGDMRAQVILRGKPYGDFGAREYREQVTPTALKVAAECLADLRKTNDIVVIEGAGSPAEVNLHANDIANMKIAEIADAPVVLVGDIDRGGCLAALVGTLELLTAEERARVKGLIINKFRGDLSLLSPGLDFLAQKTGIPILGVLPYLQLELPEEDSQGLRDYYKQSNNLTADHKINIGVIKLPRISNFTDFDALTTEPDVELKFISTTLQLESCDLIIIPGTKNTTADLEWLQNTGLAAKIKSLAQRVLIFGICGGYQMLGTEIRDPLHLESELERVAGLNLLPISTEFKVTNKVTLQVKGIWYNADGQAVPIRGYEIHQGISEIVGQANLFHLESGEDEGYQMNNIYGTYLHGCFDNDEFRWEILNLIRKAKHLPSLQGRSYKNVREESYRLLATTMGRHLDIQAIYQMMGIGHGA
jgi:adenosylcobyric acid synthase